MIARNLAIVCNVLLAALLGYVGFAYLKASEGLLDSTGHVVGLDFMVFWTAGVLVEQGHLMELFDAARFHALQEGLFASDLPVKPRIWAHPPPMLLLTPPLAQFPYAWALAGWSVLFLTAYLLAAGRFVLLAAPATFANLVSGQTGFLVAALHFGALRQVSQRPVLAGVLFGLVIVKPHLGVLIPVALLAARAYSAFTSAALTVLGLALLSGLVFGWEVWRLWFTEALSHQASVIHIDKNSNILLSIWQGARHFGLPDSAAWTVQALSSLAAATATWWAFSRLRRGLIDQMAAFSILMLATAMATPYIFNYDWALVSPAALYALTQWRRKAWTQKGMRLTDLGECLVWLVIWLLPAMWMLPFPALPTAAGVALPAGLALLVRGAIQAGR